MKGKLNIAARAGRRSASHRRTAILGWLAFVILAFAIGGATGTNARLDQYNQGTGESGRADTALGQKFHRPAGERVLVQARGGQTSDAEIRAGAREVSARLANNRAVTGLRRPVLSGDGHSLLVEFQPMGSSNQATKRVASTLAATGAAQRAYPDLRIEQFGDASSNKALPRLCGGLPSAEILSLPITLDHPAGRLRRAGRRGHPAAARDLGRDRDDRPASAR